MTEATTECSVERRVERGVREVHVTPLTVPVSVYRDGNRQHAKKVIIIKNSIYQKDISHADCVFVGLFLIYLLLTG